MRRLLLLLLMATALPAAACSSGDDGTAGEGDGRPERTTTVPVEEVDAGPAPEVEPGKAVVVAGDERFEFAVHECLVGEETGAPNRRLALSASETEPFEEARTFLHVNILVSVHIEDWEEHVIEIVRYDGANIGAADMSTPGRGGPAPDDWIQVDEDAHVVHGSGFELRVIDESQRTLPPGTLVADCP